MRNDESADTGKRFGPWPLPLAIVPGALLLYVLSIGPAVAICPDDAPKAVEVLYGPIIWLNRNTPLHEPIEWYVDLWERHRRPSTGHVSP